MTEPDDVAIDALRRFDQAHDLDAELSRRIETRMLARFDESAEATMSRRPAGFEVVELQGPSAPRSRRRSGIWVGLVAAAAIAALGAIVLLRTDPATPEVPSTQPPAPVDDEMTMADQLRTYCLEFVTPLAEASGLWSPGGFQSEERADVLVAVEQAAQGLVDLTAPVAARLGDRDLELLDLATEARRAATLGPGGDQAVAAARDAILAEVDRAVAELDVPECRPG